MKFGKTQIQLKKGDITQETVDIIVNAANSSLAGGSGVDGAIHRVGGSAILEECQRIRQERGRCPTGEAVITGPGQLKAKKVIHTVGPVWHGGEHHESELLKSAYKSSLTLAQKTGAKKIAFPSISTGVYGYPIEKACPIALTTVIDYTKANPGIDEVRFILFTESDFQIYQEILNGMKS